MAYSQERPFLDFWAGPWFSVWTFWTPVLCLPKYPFGPWSPVLLWQETPAASLAGTAELGRPDNGTGGIPPAINRLP